MADRSVHNVLNAELGEVNGVSESESEDLSDNESDSEFVPSDSELSEAEAEDEVMSDWEPDTQSDSDSDEESLGLDEANLELKNFRAKDGTEWSRTPPPPTRVRAHNIIRGPIGIAKNTGDLESPVDAFRLYMNQKILSQIVQFTNIEAERVYQECNMQKAWKLTDETEILAFLGLIITGGLYKAKHLTCELLWSPKHGPPIFRATMSAMRFKALMRFMRFDDKATRSRRREKDKLAPIRDIFDEINRRLLDYYVPNESLTVDEQLIPFRGRCSFRQYIPSKPDKYGLKIFWIADSRTFYPMQGKAYLGKEGGNRAEAGLGKRIVLELAAPFFRSGRNITCDNYFTDLGLVNDLLREKLTLVGTLRKNKACIPSDFQPRRAREENSSLFGFQERCTIVSYVPKKNKAVMLLSSMHHTGDIVVEDNNKPEIIKYYNETKGGVDSLDQLIHAYMSKRRSNRWPMAFFFNLIDISGVAAFVLWLTLNRNWMGKKRHKRRLFLQELSLQLVRPGIFRRQQNPGRLSKDIVHAMECVVGETAQPGGTGGSKTVGHTLRRCFLCPRSKDRKSRQYCVLCKEFVCSEHSEKSGLQKMRVD